MIAAAGLPQSRLVDGSDTAWLVAADPVGATPGSETRRTVAITLRDLVPFDRRLGVTQEAYEEGFAGLCNSLIARGYDVIAFSTCTGIESYHRDDRIPALRVKARITSPGNFHVVMDEINDLQLGRLLGSCELLIGTRLHSAIIAMNFGTPALALNYEHKSAGIMEQLGLPDLAFDVGAITDGTIGEKVTRCLEDLPALRARVAAAVRAERARALSMLRDALRPIARRP
jgi:colanic acid/amylovoran biosynthesis protein